MKISNLLWVFTLLSCAHPNSQTDAVGNPIRKAEVLLPSTQNLNRLAVVGENSVIFIQGDFRLLRVTKGKSEELSLNIQNPTALGFDDRRNEIYLAEKFSVHILKGKDPKNEIAKIDLPEGTVVKNLYYSVMNRKAYATVEGDEAIWEIDPRSKKAKLLIEASVFSQMNLGKPEVLFASTDGARLFVLTQTEHSTSLVRLRIRNKKPEVMRTFENTRGVGIDMIKNHLVLAFSTPPFLRGYDLGRKVWVDFETPPELLHEPKEMKLDRTIAMVLDRAPQASALVQVPLTFKD